MTSLNEKGFNEKYSVATTALEDFWDTSYPLLFMGEWCKRFSRRSYWSSIKGETLQTGWDAQSMYQAIDNLDSTYERLLPVLTAAFNSIHGVSFSSRYWRIAMGPWLIHYLHNVHDKYHHIELLREKYPAFTTVCLDESCYLISSDTLDYMGYVKGDAYNLQLYSQMFALLGYAFPQKKIKVIADESHKKVFSGTRVVRLKKIVLRFVMMLLRKKHAILFSDTSFARFAIAALMVKTNLLLIPCELHCKTSKTNLIDEKKRGAIASVIFGNTEFEKLLMPLIAMNVPQSMLEDYRNNTIYIKQEVAQSPKAILSTVSWHYDDLFKIFSAEASENGTMLLGIQHGGNYGSLRYLLSEKYELSITDRYYSWGWIRSDCHAKIKPLPAPKLIGRTKCLAKSKSQDILYIGASWSRYMIQYPLTVDYWNDYFYEQALFLASMNENTRKHLVIRPHREDLGWDCVERFREAVPEARIETWEVPFAERLMNSCIMICDHPCYSTTTIEALSCNKPVILFYNPRYVANHFNEHAKPYWERLKEAEILFDTPLEAANKLNEVFDTVEMWWNDPKRQDAVNIFLNTFGKTSKEWEKQWLTEFRSI